MTVSEVSKVDDADDIPPVFFKKVSRRTESRKEIKSLDSKTDVKESVDADSSNQSVEKLARNSEKSLN